MSSGPKQGDKMNHTSLKALVNRLNNGSRLYNLHSHTQFCDGRAPMEQFARAAAAGFEVYGFSPHSPVPIASKCNMCADRVGEYFDEVKRLRDIYGDRTELLCAMEIDYLDDSFGPSADYFRGLPLDYRIGSVHFIKSPRDGFIDIDGSPERFVANLARHFDNDLRGVVSRFFDSTAAMIEAGGFDIVGHIDKITRNATYTSPGIADEPWFISAVSALIDMAADRDLIIEVNTKILDDKGRVFPDPRYAAQLRRRGATLAVNSDAHRPDLINAGRRRAFVPFLA